MMQTRKLTHIAILITFALVIHTVEAMVPVPMIVPGAKLGLANVITLLAFVIYGFKSAMFIAVIRAILGSIFIGNFLGFGFFLSFGGAVLSTLAMALGISLWRRGAVSLIAVSIMGAVAHNTAQVLIASILIQNINLLRLYLPLLLFLALPTGFFTGLVVIYAEKALSRVIKDVKQQ
ncbi:Gx transporter family protein [Dethiobacter alkaliphilus]|uniref:Gx transporter family protein n=1 Tax=Dethiobacter alkaliphilus TaxID=427926 RepID=UPI0022268EC5|nr:Gx transporter family protein [Dethiobacter alkaliphilus]MCW3491356.1 Gx transporter family protein [Dethiobacter alkaliphilus]